MPLIDLLKKVRVDGRVKIDRSLSLEKSLPIIIVEDDGDLPYLNSGGRSIIFDYGGSVYRLKGVDPNGILTKRAALSKKNKIGDVYSSYFVQKEITKKWPPEKNVLGKPFGVLTEEDAMREASALEILNECYEKMGVNPPYEYVGTYRFQDGNVQNLYKIPSLDSDLRLEEFDQLMRDRLNRCSTKKLERKAKQIFKLYRRFLTWEGWNLGLLARNKLEPSPNSWVPQNFVISRYVDGYGIFRVDHTSTRRNEKYEPEKLIEKILDESGLQTLQSDTFGAYTHIPTSILIALAFKFATGKKPKKKKSLFEQSYLYRGKVQSWERGYGYYLTIYGIAFASGFKRREAPEPIPERMIREAFVT